MRPPAGLARHVLAGPGHRDRDDRLGLVQVRLDDAQVPCAHLDLVGHLVLAEVDAVDGMCVLA